MADQNLHNMTDSWNSALTPFDAIKMNVTDAASAAESNLLLLQLGGNDKFKVRKDGQVTITNNGAGAGEGPILNLFRDSASPAANDVLGKLLFSGRDSGGNATDYAEVYPELVDPANGSEDASVLLRAMVGGSMTTLATFASSGLTLNSPLAIQQGGTGATSASTARDALFLGSIATQDANNVSITGGAASGLTINNAVIGGTTPAAVNATTIDASGGIRSDAFLQAESIAPYLELLETDGTVTQNMTRFYQDGDELRVQTRTNGGVFVSTDYVIAKDASGAAQHRFRIANVGKMTLSSTLLDLTGADISLDDGEYYQSGASNDFFAGHDGTNTIIRNTTGTLFVDEFVNSGLISFRTYDSGGVSQQTLQLGGANPSVNLYYNSDLVTYTGATGLNITHGDQPRLNLLDETGTATALNAILQFFYGSTLGGRVGFLGADDMFFINELAAGNNYYDVENASGIHFFRTGGNVERMRVDSQGIDVTGVITATSTIDATGNITSVGYVQAGSDATGPVTLTTNDGGGNANVCFNHTATLPGQAGSSARILSGVDSTTAGLNFQLADNVTAGVAPTMTTMMSLSTSGVDVTGAITATGNISGNSDERLKSKWKSFKSDIVVDLAKLKRGTYYRDDLKQWQVGVSAQGLQPIMPKAVDTDAKGFLTVAYGQAALVGVCELAAEVVQLRKEFDEYRRLH